jgi:UDP-N-acetyl-D-mannosaminuronate dehydrogenase
MDLCVVALGKIGLPIAVQAASKGHRVRGADISSKVVGLVSAGVEPFPGELGLSERLSDVVSKGLLTATTDTTGAVSESDAVIVVPPWSSTRMEFPISLPWTQRQKPWH